MRRRAAVALLVAAPLLVAARDHRGDPTACDGPTAARGPDLVAVRGSATELGTVASWRLVFAEPVAVPSTLTIEILVRDPQRPAVAHAGVPGVNRVVRWRATSADRPTEISWLPDDGSTSFNPPVVHGRVVTIAVPGRILLGESPIGTQSVARARWSVIVREGDACDRLGGRPRFRLDGASEDLAVATPGAAAATAGSSGSAAVVIGVGALVVAAAFGISARLRRKRSIPSR